VFRGRTKARYRDGAAEVSCGRAFFNRESRPFLCDSARINALLAQQPIPPENSMGCLGANEVNESQ